MGSTDGAPYVGLKDWKIGRILVEGSGTEAWQEQHKRGNSKTSKIYISNADTKLYNNFQNWQNAAGQLSVDEGVHEIDNIFIDGFGAVGLSCHGGAPYTMPDGSVIQAKLGDTVVINNAYIYGGHNAIYMNVSCSKGITWEIKNLWVGGMNDDFANNTGNRKIDYYLDHAGSDNFIIGKLIHDGSKPRIAKDASKFQIGEVVLQADFPRPKYKLPNYQFIDWSEDVEDYFPNENGTNRTYKAGQYVMDREFGTPTVFLKCLQDNISTSVRPKNSPELYQVITWDENGYPSDDAMWNELPQRSYPPGNFAHTYDSPLKDFFFNTPAIPVDPKDEIIKGLQKEIDLLNMQLSSAINLNEVFRVKLSDSMIENDALKNKIEQVKQIVI
jgi:hypothetical protein